jgi:hypothetical protein
MKGSKSQASPHMQTEHSQPGSRLDVLITAGTSCGNLLPRREVDQGLFIEEYVIETFAKTVYSLLLQSISLCY